VVRDVLSATLDELSEHGFGTLSIESVAQRAQVNKTTIYRRWPTKEALVRAAFVASADEAPTPPADGPVRQLLIALMTRATDKLSTPTGRSIMRMVVADDVAPELTEIMETVREHRLSSLRASLEQAKLRGELPRGLDADLLFSMLVGTVFYRLFVLKKAVPRAFIEGLVDLTLLGLTTEAKKKRPRVRKARPTKRKPRTEARPRRRP